MPPPVAPGSASFMAARRLRSRSKAAESPLADSRKRPRLCCVDCGNRQKTISIFKSSSGARSRRVKTVGGIRQAGSGKIAPTQALIGFAVDHFWRIRDLVEGDENLSQGARLAAREYTPLVQLKIAIRRRSSRTVTG